MNEFAVGERWVFPPGQADIPEKERAGYLVRVPTYYETATFRDRFMREIGAIPSELEILSELRLALPVVEPDEARRSALDDMVSEAVAAVLIPGASSVEGRSRIDALKRRAMGASVAFRGYMADVMTRENVFPLELIRYFCRGWRGLVDAQTGAPVEPEFVDRDTGDALDAGPGERGVLSRGSLEFMPPLHVQWLAREIEGLSGPKGTTAKNYQSRSSTHGTPTTSSTAANGPQATPRRKATRGTSRTSR
ncbi:hypothetical protein [Thalassobaculum sp.]|uniref:hypothetical protein n=1 Tax=Thalassobaculum sp. TaxID=2022740 RepID=UPI0032EBBCCB